MGRGRGVSEHLWVSSAGWGGVAVPVVISTSRDLANTHFRTPLITESESLFFFFCKAPSLGRSVVEHAFNSSVSVSLREASLVYTGNCSTLEAPGQLDCIVRPWSLKKNVPNLDKY